MAPRFDAERLTLDLAVADLLEGNLLRSLGFANRGGYERLWLGQAIHSRYQEQALGEDPTYRREVHVTCSFLHRGWTVTVQGRIDGVRREPDGSLVVEEIKSVRRGGSLAPAVREMYQRQALLYAWMLGRLPGRRGDRRQGRAGADRDRQRRVEREPLVLDGAGARGRVRRRINILLHTWEAERAAAAARREAAERLVFPYGEPRPGQDDDPRRRRAPRSRTASTCCSRPPPASARPSPPSTPPCATA